ncbi:DNA ligase 4 [Galendromus occidentalis]|uniref:DNA ligase n=1 Tax=Galendromus occidentalis TaxID=34638 RepID=A0AAJ7SJ51_9ACAR|nr:DNA ligase 4 [Galendromus occidentalis]
MFIECIFPSLPVSFFPIIRLLLPNLDNVRGAYHMKETMIGREYIRLTGLSQETRKAQEILNFKRSDPSGKRFGFRKGFETLVFEILKNRSNMKSSELSIQKINDILNEMTKSKDAAQTQLKFLFSHCDPLEHKWLIRIILRHSLNIRKSTSVVLGALHPMAEEMYSVNRNLEDICMTLYDAELVVSRPKIGLGKPFGFMLSARSNLASLESDMGHSEFLMEIKFDGERVQCHKNQNEFSYYSRGYNEYSATYGTSGQHDNSLSSYLSRAIDPHVVTCIFDGEMMSYDGISKKFVPKGRSRDLKKIKTDDVSHQPCYMIFDLLYYNGKVFTDKPLLERRRVLENLLTPIEGRVQLSAARSGLTKDEALKFMNEATSNLEEGIVIKKADGPYVPNERDAGWLKLKRDYMNEGVADLDVIIVGAYYAAGKTAIIYDSLLVAVAEDPETSSDPPKYFYSFGRVHSGLSEAFMKDLLGKTGDAWKPFNRDKCPTWLKMSSMANCPNVIIEPKSSVILTVKAAELVPTKSFMTECSMRFPRVSALRFDKPWKDCMRYSELAKLYRETKGTMTAGDLKIDLETKKEQVRSGRGRSPQRKIKVQLERKLTPVKRVKSDFLLGKEFCIFAEKSVRSALEKAVRRHGGTCVLLPRPSTFMVVADRLSFRIKTILETRDVAKVSSWGLKRKMT